MRKHNIRGSGNVNGVFVLAPCFFELNLWPLCLALKRITDKEPVSYQCRISIKVNPAKAMNHINKSEDHCKSDTRYCSVIAHFQVAACLSFKASLGAQPFKWK